MATEAESTVVVRSPNADVRERDLDPVAASEYGVLGNREPLVTASGVEGLTGCHAMGHPA